MAGKQSGGHSGGTPNQSSGTAAAGYWFPLLLFGGLTALSLPLSVLFSPGLPRGWTGFTREVYPTLTEAMYLGGGSPAGPFPFPLGWYWVGVLVTGSVLTAVWYRWRNGRAASGIRVRGYLATVLALAAAAAALPCLAWGAPAAGPDAGSWNWLDAGWRLGTFALASVAASLFVLARLSRSRALAVIALVHTAAVCLAGWIDLQQATFLPTYYPYGDPTALLPAAVLLLAGVGATAAAGLRALRAQDRTLPGCES